MNNTKIPEAERLQKGKLLLDLASESYRHLKSSNEQLTNKINNMIAINVTSISIFLGVVYFLLEYTLNFRIVIISISISLVLLLASLIVGIIGYRPLPFQFMNPMDLVREVHQDDKSYGYAVRKSAGTISAIVEINIDIVNKKAKTFKVMLSLMAIAFLFIVITTVFIFDLLICS